MSDTSIDDKPVVIDNGSGLIKSGFGGNNLPTAVFPSVVGRPRHKGVMVGMSVGGDAYVGHESIAKRGILSQKYPIEHGVITSFDDMEKIWHHTFYYELQVAPEEHTLVLTETSLNPKRNREIMTQIVFETFNVPSFYVSNQAALTLYGNGKTTGLVIESGDSVTNIVPLFEGIVADPYAIYRLDIGGNDITHYLRKMLNEKGYNMTTTYQEMQVVNDIKKKYGFVALDYEKTLACDMNEKYELPDGLYLDIGTETFRCAELLFRPELIGFECDGISKAVFESIHKCDMDIQNELFENIVLGGGNTMFKGMEQRLLKDLNEMVSKEVLIDGYLRRYYNYRKTLYKDIVDLMNRYSSFQPKIVESKQKAYSAWIGGSILSSLSTFSDVCITMEEYNETGPSIVHRKCF